MNKMFVCPDVLGEGNCRFCLERNGPMRGKENFARYEADINDIRMKRQYYANVGDVKNPTLHAKVLCFGSQIYNPIMKIQENGAWGDVSDPENGRNLLVTRTINKGKIEDSVAALPEITILANVDWIDQIHDLDSLLPEPMDVKEVEALFKGYPWKVYEPVVSGQIPRTYEGTKPSPKPGQEETKVEAKPPIQTASEQAVSNQEKANNVHAILRQKLEAKQKAQAAS